jgi:hypothetical protein
VDWIHRAEEREQWWGASCEDDNEFCVYYCRLYAAHINTSSVLYVTRRMLRIRHEEALMCVV